MTKKKTKKKNKNIIMIDNYDSFTYNIVQYIGEIGYTTTVLRSKETTIEEIAALKPDTIIISPGPGWPKDAGISIEAVNKFCKNIPILGVCLGHQVIGVAFGGRITHAKRLMHGKTSEIYHSGDRLFKGIPQGFMATRYHSLIIDRKGLPSDIEVIAETKEKEIMAIRHKKFPVWGVQFHPESILTEYGKDIIKNFLDIVYEKEK